MYKKIILWISLVLLILACDDQSTKPSVGFEPEILTVSLNERWNLNSSDALIVEVKATDPQGFSDLISVCVMKVVDESDNLVFTDSLYDDGGLKGTTDVIAGDGVFRNRFLPTAISISEGTFRFDFTVEDRSKNKTEIFSKQVVFAQNSAPLIENVNAPDQLISGSPPIIVTVTASDLDGKNDIKNVYMDVLLDDISILGKPIELLDDGDLQNSGDLFSGDSIYSFIMDSAFAAAKNGTYKLSFFIKDQSGTESNKLEQNIFLENKAGMVLSITMPDTVVRPADIPIQAKVNDPQGLSDVQRVYFELQASDGSFVEDGQGNNIKIDLFDDGNIGQNGDLTAADLIYSVILSVGTNNVADTYTFYFYTLDKVDNLSSAALATLVID